MKIPMHRIASAPERSASSPLSASGLASGPASQPVSQPAFGPMPVYPRTAPGPRRWTERWMAECIAVGCAGLGRAWTLLRRCCRVIGSLRHPAAGAVRSWIRLRMPGAAVATRARQLAVEERLPLGPKQHLYLVRCGGARLLVSSGGDGALQWMAMPEEQAGPGSQDLRNLQKRSRASAEGRAPASPAGHAVPRRRAGARSAAKQEDAR
jgi:hypothetical protein